MRAPAENGDPPPFERSDDQLRVVAADARVWETRQVGIGYNHPVLQLFCQ